MANPSTLLLPLDSQVILPDGRMNPLWWEYFQNLQVGLGTVDLTSQVTGILPHVNGGTGNTTGAATTAATLSPGRTINGVAFDGSTNITVTAAAGTLSGATLASGVTGSSLTSVGTLTSLGVSGVVSGMSDIYTTTWTDYASTSTIVGWSSFTSKFIFYKTVGKLVYVQFSIFGTSNSTAISFTLPITSAPTIVVEASLAFPEDNGVVLTTPGLIVLNFSDTVVNLYPAATAPAWTNSGTKAVRGQFWYEGT